MLAPTAGFAQQQDDLSENGPYEQRYFARERGAAIKPYVPQLPALPTVPFQADKDGKSNELIVLLDYGQTARLQTLLGAAGKAEATVTVRLIRKYNVARDDHAIFPETAWPTMQSQGYTQNINTTDWLGYVYPNTGSMPVIQ
jgi:hypothetical protein